MATPIEVERAAGAHHRQGQGLPSTFEAEARVDRRIAQVLEEARGFEGEVTYPDVERYTLAMFVVSFLLVLAGAAMYQSAALGAQGLDAYFVVGLLAVAAAGITNAVVHSRMKARLLELGRASGLSEARARQSAQETLDAVERLAGR